MSNDVFRKDYRVVSDETKENIKQIKNKAEKLYEAFEQCGINPIDQRCMALAKTNLEQAVMWSIKAIT